MVHTSGLQLPKGRFSNPASHAQKFRSDIAISTALTLDVNPDQIKEYPARIHKASSSVRHLPWQVEIPASLYGYSHRDLNVARGIALRHTPRLPLNRPRIHSPTPDVLPLVPDMGIASFTDHWGTQTRLKMTS
ncbi:hypothetical protein PCH_Pc22g20220 [Penicillium rubens Wisconsin 54-1255]|uniref:Uncharacterized protein n=1 Tax=Penicillium rubens (strain ATCC 28089 / DSM 1075 / NRRL 1951 / Wisconsin 54-1255) TaxID=500485 RepID=B6HQS5_PENRW|nr:hypothetical protein PCH_Pc22g20220 [Penicillium rubens Wisconsin 54-1255]